MHDLVHDLAQPVTEEEVCCITNDSSGPNISERIRHLSIYRGNSFGEFDSIRLQVIKSLKTCIGHVSDDVVDQLSHHVLKCYSLRALDFERRKKLSSSIGHLKYLRYLNLSHGHFTTLPESLCKLWNLQILKLDDCYQLQKLPNSLIHLKALQHLSLRSCRSLSSLPRQIGKLTSLRTLCMYVVGTERGSLLAELGQLNLKGELSIKHLERVKSVMDAREANMSGKHLNQLRSSWETNEESQLQENVEQILEVLQPHTQQLQTLLVRGYTGARFPQWIPSPSLRYLDLMDCNCLHLPQLGKLPSLKSLRISNMGHARYQDEESYDSGVAGGFPALEFLSLWNLPELIRLSREDRENMFPRLSTLQIAGCPKLLGLPCLPSLSEMRIIGTCSQDLLSSIHRLHSLESLHFKDNEELTCFPDGMLRNLASLKILDIYGLSKLEQLPTEIVNLNAVQEIYITRCKSLKSLTDEVLQGLHSLKTLDIKTCQKFNMSASFQYLTCLEKLMIMSCPEIEGFHGALQHMTALQSLSLCDLPNLASLPDCFGNLGLLRELIISKCPNLTCLPMSIQCLTGLRSLRIHGCAELEKRCQKESGEDWPKIAHVQNIVIQNGGLMFWGPGGLCHSLQDLRWRY